MSDDELLTTAESPEKAAPPSPPTQCQCNWTYSENGQLQDSGAAVCSVSDTLKFQCKSGPPFNVAYRDIGMIEDRDVDLTLTLRSGGVFELSKMGRLHDQFRQALMEKWTALNRKQALAEETAIATFRGRARRDDATDAPCGIGVYETAVVLDFESGVVTRLPLVFTGRPQEQDWAFTFTLLGETWVLSHIGRDTDAFRRALEQAVNALETKALQRIQCLCPGMPPFKQRALVSNFLDGRAVPLAAAQAAWPKLGQAMVDSLAQAGLRESWDVLSQLGDAAQARIGEKTSLQASKGTYRWFFLPVVRGDKAALIMEASSEGEAGRATYAFKVPNGPAAMEATMDALNYALVMVNFRREPIYMSDAQMQKPENAHYQRSVARVPALAELRANFLGRVAHSSAEAWQRGLEELLNKM